MRWIAATLLVVNVLIFLGISNRQEDSHQDQNVAFLDVNLPSMRLLSEIQHQGIVPANALDNQVLPKTNAGAMAIERTEYGGEPDLRPVKPSDSAVVGGQYCFRVGPFRQEDNWKSTVKWIEQQPRVYFKTQVATRPLRSVQVYLGPYQHMAQANPAIDILKRKNLDYVVNLLDDGMQVSLGYFTQEKLAQTYIEHLKEQGIDAQLQPQYRSLGPWYWMDVEVDQESRAQLLSRDWEMISGARVRETVCVPAVVQRKLN